MRIDGERLVGSRAIMRRSISSSPTPAAPAAGSPAYARVLEAERWGDEVLQGVPRRVSTSPSCAGRARCSAMSATPSCRCRSTRCVLRAARRAPDGAEKRRARTGRPRRPRGAAGPAGADRRLDRLRPCSAASSRTPRDLQIGSTSAPAAHGRRPARVDRRHRAAELARYFPPTVGEVPAGTLPSAWLAPTTSS